MGCGTLIYVYTELLRQEGREIPVVSFITTIAQRNRDVGKFVLGPVTLGLGAMSALIMYPDPAASIAIYALAFGDGLASLVGKYFGRIRIPFTGGKTIAGSLACFTAVFFVAFRISGMAIQSVIIAAAATLIEMAPSKDLDNILMPTGTGLIASQLIFL